MSEDVLDQAVKLALIARDVGAEAERIEIVAWLRKGNVPDHSDEGGCPASKFADAIERGDHLRSELEK